MVGGRRMRPSVLDMVFVGVYKEESEASEEKRSFSKSPFKINFFRIEHEGISLSNGSK